MIEGILRTRKHAYHLRFRFFVFVLILLIVFGMGIVKIHEKISSDADINSVDQNEGCTYEQGMMIMLASKAYINSGLTYSDKYYTGGYPPAHVGVCTDVVWHGLSAINVNFKELIDEDTEDEEDLYENVISYRDTGLDFRLVPVVNVYLRHHAVSLSTDPANLLAWQPGDIVVYENKHVAVVSCLRNMLGYPFVIQHGKDPAGDENRLINDSGLSITAHYRWPETIIMQGDKK